MQTTKFCSAHDAPLSQSSVENTLICPCQLPVPQAEDKKVLSMLSARIAIAIP